MIKIHYFRFSIDPKSIMGFLVFGCHSSFQMDSAEFRTKQLHSNIVLCLHALTQQPVKS